MDKTLNQEEQALAEAKLLNHTLLCRADGENDAPVRQFTLATPHRLSVRALAPEMSDEVARFSVMGAAFGAPVPLGIYALTTEGKIVLAGKEWRSPFLSILMGLGIGQIPSSANQVAVALELNRDTILSAAHDPADKTDHRLSSRSVESVRVRPEVAALVAAAERRSAAASLDTEESSYFAYDRVNDPTVFDLDYPFAGGQTPTDNWLESDRLD